MSRSSTLFQQAQQHIPGGVNSPVRAFKAVGGEPVFLSAPRAPTSLMPTPSNTSTMYCPGVP